MNDTNQQTPSAQPRTGGGFIVVLVGLLLCSLLMGFAGYACVADSLQFDRHRDWIWGIGGFACAAMMLIASLVLLINVWLKNKSLTYIAIVLLGLSTLVNGFLVAQGNAVLEDAKFRGGDWGALHTGMARMFNVFLPMMLAIFCGVVTAALLGLFRSPQNPSP